MSSGLSVSTCTSSLALLSLKLSSITGPTLCFQALYVSLPAHMLAFGQAANGQGRPIAFTSTCVTTGSLICFSDVSLAVLLIKRHGVVPPLAPVSLSLTVSFTLFVTVGK